VTRHWAEVQFFPCLCSFFVKNTFLVFFPLIPRSTLLPFQSVSFPPGSQTFFLSHATRDSFPFLVWVLLAFCRLTFGKSVPFSKLLDGPWMPRECPAHHSSRIFPPSAAPSFPPLRVKPLAIYPSGMVRPFPPPPFGRLSLALWSRMLPGWFIFSIRETPPRAGSFVFTSETLSVKNNFYIRFRH